MKYLLYFLNFMIKGWEVSLLAMLPFIKVQYDLTLFQVGILSTIFVAVQVIAILIAPRLRKLYSAETTLVMTVTCSVLSWICMVLGLGLPSLVLAYVFGGCASGIYQPISDALVARIVDKKTLGKEMGDFAAAGDVGRIGIVAGVTSLLAFLPIRTVALICAAITLVSLFFVHKFTKNVAFSTEEKVQTPEVSSPLKHKPYVRVLMASTLDSFASSSLYIFIPFLMQAKGLPLSYSGLFISIFFVGYLVGRMGLGRIADKVGLVKTLIFAEGLMAIFLFVFITLNFVPALLIILFLLGACTRGTGPILKAMIAASLPDHHYFERGYSTSAFFTRSASIISRPTFGLVADVSGIKNVFRLSALIAIIALLPVMKDK